MRLPWLNNLLINVPARVFPPVEMRWGELFVPVYSQMTNLLILLFPSQTQVWPHPFLFLPGDIHNIYKLAPMCPSGAHSR